MSDFQSEMVMALLAAAVTPAVSIFASSNANLPPGDGPFLSMIEYGGSGPTRTHNAVSFTAYQRPSLQVISRGVNTADTRALARSAYNVLAAIRNVKINGTWYVDAFPSQEPHDMGKDATGRRVQFGFNITFKKRPSTESSVLGDIMPFPLGGSRSDGPDLLTSDPQTGVLPYNYMDAVIDPRMIPFGFGMRARVAVQSVAGLTVTPEVYCVEDDSTVAGAPVTDTVDFDEQLIIIPIPATTKTYRLRATTHGASGVSFNFFGSIELYIP